MSERKEGWFRIIVLIVSGIILHFWSIAVVIIAIINWLMIVISGKRSKDLAMFSEMWNTENYKFCKYLTGVTNRRPFPFSKVESFSKFER